MLPIPIMSGVYEGVNTGASSWEVTRVKYELTDKAIRRKYAYICVYIGKLGGSFLLVQHSSGVVSHPTAHLHRTKNILSAT